MEWNSKKMCTFVPWFRKMPRHRGEQLSFDPSENLENSMYKGEKSESCSFCSNIYTACSAIESATPNNIARYSDGKSLSYDEIRKFY